MSPCLKSYTSFFESQHSKCRSIKRESQEKLTSNTKLYITLLRHLYLTQPRHLRSNRLIKVIPAAYLMDNIKIHQIQLTGSFQQQGRHWEYKSSLLLKSCSESAFANLGPGSILFCITLQCHILYMFIRVSHMPRHIERVYVGCSVGTRGSKRASMRLWYPGKSPWHPSKAPLEFKTKSFTWVKLR